jgi:hypothetical protein
VGWKLETAKGALRLGLEGASTPGGKSKSSCPNTALANLSGLSKPTKQTRNGNASANATGSIGNFKAIATGSEISKARTAEEMMANGSQNEEPRFRDRRSLRRR